MTIFDDYMPTPGPQRATESLDASRREEAVQADRAALHLTTASPVAQTITLAGTKVLCGEAFREIVAKRLNQVERHGFTIDHDLDRPAQVLIDNAIGRLQRARDQLNDTAASRQGDHAAVNLRIGAALAWAALDRVHAGGGAHPQFEG